MKRSQKFRNWLKWSSLVTLLIAIGGVAYAVLITNPLTITGNTIETATANMMISLDGQNFGVTYPGFDFNGLVPGGSAVPVTGYSFYLKNTGAVPLNPKILITKQPTNPNNVSLDKVNIIVTTIASGAPAQSFSVQSLLNGGQVISSTSLGVGSTQQYKLQVSMSPDAVTGNSAAISGIDLVLSGVAGS